MPIKILKRGEIWHYRGSAAGRRLRGSTGTTDKKRAERIAAEREAREWKSHLDGPGAHMTFAQASYLYREAGKATRYLAPIEDFWKDELVRNITAEAIRQSAYRLYPHVKDATRNCQVISPTQAIINHAAKLGHCRQLSVERFKVTNIKTKTPITAEWAKVFAANASPHMGALCLFMLGTGSRVSEAIDLRWRHVDLAGATATIYQSKIDDTRVSHLSPAVLAAIANIQSNRQPDAKVFKYSTYHTARPVWINAIKRAGLEHRSFHCCRHGFATALLRAGVDVKTIAKLGGWKDVRHVLQTYAHALDDITVTDRIFDTTMTQDDSDDSLTNCNERVN